MSEVAVAKTEACGGTIWSGSVTEEFSTGRALAWSGRAHAWQAVAPAWVATGRALAWQAVAPEWVAMDSTFGTSGAASSDTCRPVCAGADASTGCCGSGVPAVCGGGTIATSATAWAWLLTPHFTSGPTSSEPLLLREKDSCRLLDLSAGMADVDDGGVSFNAGTDANREALAMEGSAAVGAAACDASSIGVPVGDAVAGTATTNFSRRRLKGQLAFDLSAVLVGFGF